MKHIVKILTLVVAITALWVGLLQTSIIPRSHTWLVSIYVIMCLILYFLLFFVFGYKKVLGRGGFPFPFHRKGMQQTLMSLWYM